MEEVVGAPGDHRALPGRGHSTAYSLDGLIEVADRLLRIPRCVFDPDAGDAGRDGRFDGDRHLRGGLAVTVLEVTVHRQPGELAEQARVSEVFLAGQVVDSVG